MSQEHVIIFFSWQSELKQSLHRHAIHDALIAARKDLEAELDCTIDIQDATRGLPGSPKIVEKILERIKAADIFVGDVTLIHSTSTPDRKTPNPNVMMELGYAVAHLGWERILLVLNTQSGSIEQLPFDIRPNRATPYQLAQSPKKNVADPQLTSTFKTAIKAVIQAHPSRPSESNLNVAEIHHQRDLRTLRRLFRNIDFPEVVKMLSDLPARAAQALLLFHDMFADLYTDPAFHLYSPSLAQRFAKIYELWRVAHSYSQHYRDLPKGNYHLFDLAMDVFRTKQEEDDWKRIEIHARETMTEITAMMGEVREHFPELDIEELSAAAWNSHIAVKQETDIVCSHNLFDG